MGSGRVASVLNEMDNEPRMGRQHTEKDTAMHIFQVYGNTWCIRDYQLIPFYKLDEHRIILLAEGGEVDPIRCKFRQGVPILEPDSLQARLVRQISEL